jgi:hypothetical protein
MSMFNILVVYYSHYYPLRVTVSDHLYCFQRYAPHRCFYLNMAVRRPPAYMLKVPFELVIFDNTFLGKRWILSLFNHIVEKARPLKRLGAVKVVLPQDEFLNTDVLCDFINEFGIQYVFSAKAESEWPKIYHRVDRSKVKFSKVLTGYLEDSTLDRINRLAQSIRDRSIDIGYRSWRTAPWLGRHGMLKAQIAQVFQEHAPRKGLVIDISTRDEDTFVGDSWYEFLLKCKYTIGVEGGASILDKDGSIKAKTEAYLQNHPQASFEEVEAHCFPGIDGSAHLSNIAPRHLEACATRTCQVLIEGEYNGILKPNVHYIELKRDFSNLEDVLETIKRDELRTEITARAYRDIVESGRYTYQRFVELVLEKSLGDAQAGPSSLRTTLVWRWSQFAERLWWVPIILFRVFYKRLPTPVRSALDRFGLGVLKRA